MQIEHIHNMVSKVRQRLKLTAGRQQDALLLQESALAGFHHHRATAIWPFLREGEPLVLVRESINTFDRDAVAVYFRNDKIGYVPRRENHVVAQMLDRGQQLIAKVTQLRNEQNPWRRVRFEIKLVV